MIDTKELRQALGAVSPEEVEELLDRLEATEEDRSNFLQEMGKLCAQCDALTDALRSTAQTLAWVQHGECRGFSDDLLTTNEALEKARAALEKSK